MNLRKKKFVNLTYALQHINDIVEKDLRSKLRELVQMGKDERAIKKYFESEPDVWADVNLKRIEVFYYTKDTNDHYYAVRVAIDESFTEEYIRNKVTSESIQKILLAHLAQCNNDPKLAFSPDGIEQMNANITQLNDGVPHKPVYKVRTYEKAEKFAVGQIGSKRKKFVEADKGTRLFTFIYEKSTDDSSILRKLISLPLIDIVLAQKQCGKLWINVLDGKLRNDGTITKEWKLAFIMSPGDLVYVPTEKEIKNNHIRYSADNIYKVVSLDGENPNFIPASIASVIIDGQEYTRHNKTSRDAYGRLIKEICIPIKVDRLGNIIEQ